MTEVSMGEHFETSDHNSVTLKIVMWKAGIGPPVKVLNWARLILEPFNWNFYTQINWVRLFVDKVETFEKCD